MQRGDWQAQCDAGLAGYVAALRRLQDALSASQWSAAGSHLCEAQGALTCEWCYQDECLENSILPLLNQAKERWSDGRHPCHAALALALKRRLSPPAQEPEPLPIAKLHFTHESHGEIFRHGEHAGHTLEWLVQQLDDGHISVVKDKSMVIHAVRYHGEFRALNNRHAVALHRLAVRRPGMFCQVRVWPLTHGLKMDDGSSKDVVEKFWSSIDCEGASIRSRRADKVAPKMTGVEKLTAVHISSIDFGASESDVQAHLELLGYDCRSVAISRRKNGQSNGHARALLGSREQALQMAREGVASFNGRTLTVKFDSQLVPEFDTFDLDDVGGQLRCKMCRQACASLADVFLLTDSERLPGYSRNARGWDEGKSMGFFAIARPDRVHRCRTVPHPDKHVYPFKHELMLCSCNACLGVVQDGSHLVQDFGHEVVHFKAERVVLELRDGRSQHLAVSKWSALHKLVGDADLTSLSNLTAEKVARRLAVSTAPKVERSDNIRFVDRMPELPPSIERLCFYFVGGQGCKSGRSCSYRHPLQPELGKVRAFFKAKLCRYGAECSKLCLFTHPARDQAHGSSCSTAAEGKEALLGMSNGEMDSEHEASPSG